MEGAAADHSNAPKVVNLHTCGHGAALQAVCVQAVRAEQHSINCGSRCSNTLHLATDLTPERASASGHIRSAFASHPPMPKTGMNTMVYNCPCMLQ